MNCKQKPQDTDPPLDAWLLCGNFSVGFCAALQKEQKKRTPSTLTRIHMPHYERCSQASVPISLLLVGDKTRELASGDLIQEALALESSQVMDVALLGAEMALERLGREEGAIVLMHGSLEGRFAEVKINIYVI